MPIEQLKTELTSARPRPRVYNFWATWCQPCLAEMPGLRRFGREHPEIELVFVNLDLPSLQQTKAKKLITRMDLDEFAHLGLESTDPAATIHHIGGWPDTIPVTLLVSPAGERVKQYNLAVSPAILERALDKL